MLTAVIVACATQYERYGHRRVTALLLARSPRLALELGGTRN